jgi:hypothetical protein
MQPSLQLVVVEQPVEQPCVDFILPSLYLGDARFASSLPALTGTGITHIVTAAVLDGVGSLYPGSFTYLEVPIADASSADPCAYFEPVASFVASALAAGGTVLIHCQMGTSRSACLLLYFLMSRRGFTLRRALLHVMRVRSSNPGAPYTHPNRGFFSKLVVEDVRLHGQASLTTEDYLYHFSKGRNLRTCMGKGGGCGSLAEPMPLGLCTACTAALPSAPALLQLAAAGSITQAELELRRDAALAALEGAAAPAAEGAAPKGPSAVSTENMKG